MKKIQKMLGLAVFLFAFGILMGAAPVKAAGTVDEICGYTSKNISFSADLTGDGKDDTVKIKLRTMSDGYSVDKLAVYVNGTKVLNLWDKYYYYITVNYIHMSKTKNFLQLSGHGDNDGRMFNYIYRYDTKTKKLVKALDLKDGNLMTGGEVITVSGNQISVRHSYQPSETGWVRWKFNYVYKNGTFKLVSDTSKVLSSLGSDEINDGYGKYFRKNKFKAARTIRFYTSRTKKKLAFTAKKGDVLTLRNIKITGGKMYMQFKKGSKTGWREVDKYYTRPLFYGVSRRLAG